MVNPGTFRGKALVYLESCREKFAKGFDDGIVRDVATDIIRGFFMRFSPDTPLNEDPTDEFLATINDDRPAEEYPFPEVEGTSPEEFELQMNRWQTRQETIAYRTRVSHTCDIAI